MGPILRQPANDRLQSANSASPITGSGRESLSSPSANGCSRPVASIDQRLLLGGLLAYETSIAQVTFDQGYTLTAPFDTRNLGHQ